MSRLPLFVCVLVILICACQGLWAQPAGGKGGQLPVAGSPPSPISGGLPDHQQRSAAALKLVLTVAIALILIFFALRFYVTPAQEEGKAEASDDEPDTIERIKQALEERDAQPESEKEDTKPPDEPA